MILLVLGNPVDHSLSPTLHNAALAACNLDGSYGRRNVDAVGMAQAVAEIRNGDLFGASVTMPHKELAAQLADRLAPLAERAGAVNTLVSANGVVGHNTDVAGIRAAWREAGIDERSPVRILGTGGAAAAALLALEGREIVVSGRRPEAIASLLERVQVEASPLDWSAPHSGAVLVNATPVGMKGEQLDPHLTEATVGLFDMAYGPTSTPAVVTAADAGIPVADGRAMLLHQAAAAFELWTGIPAPVEAMRNALAAG
ncbi:MAG: shikimate dehydrogenase [Acidimicrobiia bacterium]|nr:shikimate dehydrogenase [Acidimicrobiia bacterium]